MHETYLDCDDAWLFTLTREKRREARARRATDGHTIRISVTESVEFTAVVETAMTATARRGNGGRAKRWRRRQWSAGVRNCTYCTVRMTTPSTREIRRGFICTPLTATVDHRHPLGLGGADQPRNWCMCCSACNNRKGAMTEAEFRATFTAAAC